LSLLPEESTKAASSSLEALLECRTSEAAEEAAIDSPISSSVSVPTQQTQKRKQTEEKEDNANKAASTINQTAK
jgi:hypothetical protein